MRVCHTHDFLDFWDAHKSYLRGVLSLPNTGEGIRKNHVVIKCIDIDNMLEALKEWDITDEPHFVIVSNIFDMLLGIPRDKKIQLIYFEAFETFAEENSSPLRIHYFLYSIVIVLSIIMWLHKPSVWDVHIAIFTPNTKLKKFVFDARETKIFVYVFVVFPLLMRRLPRLNF